MEKIENDKYYTPVNIANHCFDVAIAKIGTENISEIIEPSCGNGAFYHHEKYVPDIGFDIDPQFQFKNVKREDFLKSSLEYKAGRLIIGNPPYGRCMNMAQKFYKKSVLIADYIAFILPISQLNNTRSMYEFDLIHSEDLGVQIYTDRELHCCFNVFARHTDGSLNKKPTSKLKDISIYRQDSKDYDNKDFDLRMCYWGDGSAGRILNQDEHYAAEYKIKINNQSKKEEIIEFLKTFDWKEYLNCIAMRKIQQFHIIDVLKNNIIGIS